MSWFGLLFAIGAALVAANVIYLLWYVRWESANTSGVAYYGRPVAERRRFKRTVRWLSAPVMPLVSFLASLGRSRAAMPTFTFEGISGPPKVSSPEIFARAKAYRPTRDDVFVVTQMRCGTTWMEQVVHQVVTRGRGDFTAGPGGHLYATCPWIDAANSVRMEDAPLVGDPPTRIIKCHLPTSLCPYDPAARYIYVVRHPVSCFASIVDFNRLLQGPFMPDVDVMAEWFCSDRMYWSPWPQHVDGWWCWAQERPNVLFVTFEDMKSDFGAVLDRVAAFLNCALTADERRLVTETCSFQYMKEREDFFEMAPPTMFSVRKGRFLSSGQASRDADVTPAIRERILDYCRRSLAASPYAAATDYRDLATTPEPATSASAQRRASADA